MVSRSPTKRAATAGKLRSILRANVCSHFPRATRLEANYSYQRGVDMIPLMLEEGYHAKGWLGLILGTRLWYSFFNCEEEDEATFEKRLEPVVREIGDRCRAKDKSKAAAVAEGVSSTGAPNPVLATPPPRAALAVPAIPDQSFTPTMQMISPVVSQQGGGTGSVSSLTELSLFMDTQRVHDAQLLSQARAEKAELEAKIELQRQQIIDATLQAAQQQMESHVREIKMEAKLASSARVISDEQLATLQSRLQSLHAAKLLTDDELFALEDLCADTIELEASVPGMLTPGMARTSDVVTKVCKLVALSAGISADAAFARQVRRKFV